MVNADGIIWNFNVFFKENLMIHEGCIITMVIDCPSRILMFGCNQNLVGVKRINNDFKLIPYILTVYNKKGLIVTLNHLLEEEHDIKMLEEWKSVY